MLIRMAMQMSGTMADGRNWPPYLGLTEVSDIVGADLIRAEIALPGDGFAVERLAEMGIDAALPDLAGTGPAAGTEPAVPEAAEPAAAAMPGEAAATPAAADPPAQNAPKQAWLDWAVAQGADPEAADAMTKADLISRYGGRM